MPDELGQVFPREDWALRPRRAGKDAGGALKIAGTAVTATAAELNVLDVSAGGDLKIGDGTPDVIQDGEDAYVEGTLEVDSAARFDGAI